MIQVTHIDELIATRIRNAINMENEESSSVSEAMARQEVQTDAEAVARMAIRVPPDELNREQKWQWMLSKAQRK